MSDMLIGIIFLFILLGIALIFPFVIVVKWQNRQALALIIASALCGVLTAILLKLACLAVGEPTDLEFLTSVGVIGFIFSLPILSIVQWRRRKKRKTLTKKTIEEAF